MFQLQVLDVDGNPTSSRPLSAEPTYLGRAPNNDVVLERPSISGRHLAVWVAQGQIWVEDLGSRNGTFRANGQRIRTPVRVRDGEEIRIGTDVRVRFEGEADFDLASPIVLVEDLEAAVSYPVRGSRFVIADSDDADIRVSGAPYTVLLLHANGEAWVGTDEEEGPVELGRPFEVAGHRFALKGSSQQVSATWDVDRERYPYTVYASLDGPQGSVAVIEEPGTGRSYRVTAENRATLLYLLVRQLQNDRQRDLPATHEGWMTDTDLATGIWGRAGISRNLNVLVSRVRSELRTAGFNPWFIEKRKGHTRLQLEDVRADEGEG
ncbi:MAG: FHA domain-containing protein [Alphaproteobacteria bacterium]|nr:FHA domain-containing protein [Alphaproteobacteria bacterium]